MRIGVLLGGSGHYDGTDAAEATFVLLALEKSGERPVLLAPDIPQVRVVDHLSGDGIEGESRSVMREAARLSRGSIRALASWRPSTIRCPSAIPRLGCRTANCREASANRNLKNV